jgi:RimJ/RimL family protein N-acetyltransferase
MKETLPNSFTFETERFKLSLIQPDDATSLFETMNSQKTAEIISFLRWPMTLEQAESMCAWAVEAIKNQTGFLFLARNRKDSFPVGFIGVYSKEEPHVLEVGYWVTESWQGKGCATEMLKGMIKLAFEKCDAIKLIATVAIEIQFLLEFLRIRDLK